MNKVKIAIIDHVGIKAGMDHYSYFLAKGFESNHFRSIIISNFIVPDIKSYSYFIGHTSSKIKKLVNHLIAFNRAAITCRVKGCKQAVIHLFSYEIKDIYALWILKLWGIKVTAIVHDVENLGHRDVKKYQKKIFFDLTDKLLVHNEFSYNALIANFGSTLSEKLKIVPHGNFNSLGAHKIPKEIAKAHFSMREDKIYLLFFGQIKEVKGLDILIKSMPFLPEQIHLVIAGKPWKNDFHPYEDLINQLGLEQRIIKLIKFVEDQERDLLFSACDLLILPYKKIFQSGVMLMAMGFKIPIIASDLLPMKEMITDEKTGYLFASENERSLSDVIIKAIANKENLSQVTDNAWIRAEEQCNWSEIANKIIEF